MTVHTGKSWLCDSALLQHVQVHAPLDLRHNVVMAQPWPVLHPVLLQVAVWTRH